MSEGLKDHEIAVLANAITVRMKIMRPSMPQCTRGVIVETIVETLTNMDRRIDHEDKPIYPFQTDQYDGED